MNPNNTTFNNNTASKFICPSCEFVCYKKGDWNRHIVTIKHINNTSIHIKKHECKCGNIYKHSSSLSFHKKTCSNKKILEEKNDSDPSDKELIIMLLKQNSELIMKIGTNNTTTTNSHNNISNKTFNLQFFLNEECKDALNINDFVSSIKMDLNDLETTGTLGYVEGISNIINKNLNCLDQTMRPIHCSDVKREIFYVKNDNQWIKENETNKPVLTKAIKQVAHENIRQISKWQKKYPDCCDPNSTKNDTYLNIVSNAMSGLTSEEQIKNYEKIITNVAKEVIIDKEVA